MAESVGTGSLEKEVANLDMSESQPPVATKGVTDEVTLLPTGDSHTVTTSEEGDVHSLAVTKLHQPQSTTVSSEHLINKKAKLKKLKKLNITLAKAFGAEETAKSNKPLPKKFTDALVRIKVGARPMTKDFKFGQFSQPQASIYTENLVTTKLGTLEFGTDVYLFNASKIALSDENTVIAMAYPQLTDTKSQYYFYNMLREHNVLFILDLNDQEFAIDGQYYKENDSRFDGTKKLKVQIQKTEDGEQRINVTLNDEVPFCIVRKHYREWPDNGTLELSKFIDLVSFYQDKIRGGALVHCKEGMGRTMTLIVGEEIVRSVKDNTITLDNYEEQVACVIKKFEAQRGNCVIKAEEQQQLLLDATEYWLEHPPKPQS